MSRRKFLKGIAAAGSFIIVPRFVLGGPGYVAPSDQIGIGFVGVGKQARGLSSRFSKLQGARIVAGCDVDKKKLAFFAEHVSSQMHTHQNRSANIAVYEDYEELLSNKNADAIVVATPDHWHAIMSIAAMKSGKDVYCEKPLAHTIEEGRAMVKAVKKYKRVLQTGSMQRSREDFRRAVEIVRNGYLGEVSKVLVSVGDPAISCNLDSKPAPEELNWDKWIGPAPKRGYNPGIAPPISDDVWAQWRQYKEYGGGILSDWGAHMFDIAQWGLDMDNSGPVLLLPPSDPLATRGLKLIYDSGVEMVHQDFGRGFAVRFVGSKGSLDVSRSFLDSDPVDLAEIKIGDGEKRVYESNNHYQDWLDAIKNRTQPICDVETGHRSASICNLANIAYELRRPLRWDPKKEKFAKDKEANSKLTKIYRKPYRL